MKDKALDFYNQNMTRWKALETTQQRRLVMAIVAIVAVLSVTIFFMVRPTWVPLANGLDFAQSNQIHLALEERGIPSNITNGGRTVVIRERDFNDAITFVHAETDAFIGVNPTQLVDVMEHLGMATSEDTRDQWFRRAQEGEVEAMLMAMEGIAGANVTLNMADTRTRFLGIDASSATVVLTTTRDFDQAQSLQIASAVAGAVEGLTIDGVVITDQHARNVFNGLLAGDDRFANAGAGTDPRIEAMIDVDRRVRSVVGIQFTEVQVSPNIIVDTEEYRRVSNVFEAAGQGGTGLLSREHTLAEGSEGVGAGIPEPGGMTNAAMPAGYNMGGGGEFSATREVRDGEYVHNQHVTEITRPSGSLLLDESSIAVVANLDFLMFEEMFDEGFRAPGSFYTEGMSWNMYIQANQNTVVPVDTGVDWNAMIADATGIPVESVQFLAFHNFIFVDSPVVPIEWHTIILFGVLAALLAMLAYGLLRRTREEEIIDIEPELSVDDLLVSTRLEEQQLEEADSLAEIAYSIDSEVKLQIDKFVDEKPEAVAQLLRSWMNEGWE